MATTVRVQRGDTLSGIAAKAGLSLREVIAANPQISNPNLIRAGQTVKIPTKGAASNNVVTPVTTGGSTGSKVESTVTVTPVGQPMYDKDGNLVQMYSDGTTKVITPTQSNAVDTGDAYQTMLGVLRSYGLEGLGPDLLNVLQSGKFKRADGSISTALVFEEIKKTPIYQKRFAGKLARDKMIAEQVAKGMVPTMNSISEAEQIALEQSYRQSAVNAGLPVGFYDNSDDFTTLITNGYSADDFNKAIKVAQEASVLAPPEVKAALRQRYNLGEQDLMALFLDPEKAKSTLIGGGLGAASRALNTATLEATGLVGGAQADTLAGELAPGTDILKSREFTEQAAALAPLSKGDITGVSSTVTGEDVLRGVAGQTGAKGRLEKEKKRRLAEYQGGGDLATTSQGVVGLRSTSNMM